MANTKECPNCGAEIPALSLKCGYCGFELKTEQKVSVNHIQELQNRLIEADNSVTPKEKMLYGEAQVWNKKASIISCFTLPTTKKDLVDLLLFSYSNYEGCKGNARIYGDPVKNAWLGKAKQAYMMLKVYAKDDDNIEHILNEHTFLEGKKVKKAGKQGCLRLIVASLILPVFFIILYLVG